MTRPESPSDWHRLATVSSVAHVVARHVENLRQLPPEEVPSWLAGLGVPAGWQIARFADGTHPSRIAVYGPRPEGRWDACETITVFGFTGYPPANVVHANADRTFRALNADGVDSRALNGPSMPGAYAVRSSGYFNTAGLHLWAQETAYVAGTTEPGEGRLILHSIFVQSGCRASLDDDLKVATDALYQAFLQRYRYGRGRLDHL